MYKRQDEASSKIENDHDDNDPNNTQQCEDNDEEEEEMQEEIEELHFAQSRIDPHQVQENQLCTSMHVEVKFSDRCEVLLVLILRD